MVFGALVEGGVEGAVNEEVLALIEGAARPEGTDEKPSVPVVIADCGVLMPAGADH